MKTGDIVFIRGNSWISKLIRMLDGEFSHLAIVLSDKGTVLEAQRFTKSRIVPFYFDNYEIVDLGLSQEQRDKLLKLSVDLVGYRYDYKQILGILWSKLFKTKRYNNPNNMICSELLVYLLFQLDWFDNPSEAEYLLDATPNEIYSYLNNSV